MKVHIEWDKNGLKNNAFGIAVRLITFLFGLLTTFYIFKIWALLSYHSVNLDIFLLAGVLNMWLVSLLLFKWYDYCIPWKEK